MPRPSAGEVWLVDPGLAAKVRPCLILSDCPADDELALVVVVPHTTAVSGNRWELAIKEGLRAIPKSGTCGPNMGSAMDHHSIGCALFGRMRREVLALFYRRPERSFYLRQVIRSLGIGQGSVQRELARLAGAGLLVRTRVGSQVHYQANPASPVFSELKSLMVKSAGVGDVLHEALAPLAACGYRASREAHHHRVIQSLTYTIGADARLVAQLEAFRKRRNIGDYERAGAVSRAESAAMVTLAQSLRREVGNWLQANHPELL
jgi:mRNA-degrading endonuclease toxin of MazEF toxin-antitoxin module